MRQKFRTFLKKAGNFPAQKKIKTKKFTILMGKAKKLSLFEQGQITAFKAADMTINEISEKLNRSRQVISKYLLNPAGYGTKKSSGRPKKLSLRTRSRIIKLASGKKITANRIKGKLDLKVNKSTILRVLKNEGKLVRTKIMRKPRLQQIHKAKRLVFSGRYRNLGPRWKNVVFSDEKKFNLDGPDGYNYYWSNLNTNKLIYSKRAMGGESLMVWAFFNSEGKSELVFIDGSIDSIKYQSVLESHLLPFIIGRNSVETIYQQDNAKPHVSRSTKNWFEGHNITLMEWPPYSPDLNPIENLWGDLARAVYSESKEYSNINELKSAIIQKWEEISPRILKALVSSMERRIDAVVANLGGSTDY